MIKFLTYIPRVQLKNLILSKGLLFRESLFFYKLQESQNFTSLDSISDIIQVKKMVSQLILKKNKF